jgi:hypothetical protein
MDFASLATPFLSAYLVKTETTFASVTARVLCLSTTSKLENVSQNLSTRDQPRLFAVVSFHLTVGK